MGGKKEEKEGNFKEVVEWDRKKKARKMEEK